MVLKLILFFLIGYNAYMIHSLKVYQNAAKLFDKSTNESPHIDLTFNENGEVVNWKKGLTSCVRFNYKKNPLRDILWIGLKGKESQSSILNVTTEITRSLVNYANSNSSFYMIVSNDRIKPSLSVNRWHHLCIGLDPIKSQAVLVLVREFSY